VLHTLQLVTKGHLSIADATVSETIVLTVNLFCNGYTILSLYNITSTSILYSRLSVDTSALPSVFWPSWSISSGAPAVRSAAD